MNQSESEQNYLELQEALSIILETAAQKNYRLNYPTIDFQSIPEIECCAGLREVLAALEPYLRNRALITAPPSAPPEDLLGVTYFAYKMGYLDRHRAEAVMASKMAYIPDLMKLQVNETVISEASLLEVAEACYVQRQNEPMYRKNFADSCQRFIQTQACIQLRSQMKLLDSPFSEIPLASKEENIIVRVEQLAVMDQKIGVEDYTNTQLSPSLWTKTVPQNETFTIEFSSAVLQQLYCLLPEHKKTWAINSDCHCVNLQSYLRACLARQIVIKEYDDRWRQKFNIAKSKYIFNLVDVADKITAAQRAKYRHVSAEKKYSITDLKTDLNKCYQEFKQACLYPQECDLSGPELANHFCEKGRAEPSLVQTDEWLLFLERIKQVSLTYDLQAIHLYVVNNQPYLYGKKNSIPTDVQAELVYGVNPGAETEGTEIDFILPSIPEDDQIDKKKSSKLIHDSGQGLLCLQVADPSSKRAAKNNTCPLYLEKKVIDHLTSTYYKAQYTEEITRLDEKISHAVAKFNTNLQAAVSQKKYSESHLHELEELFDRIKSDLNAQHDLIKKRAHLVFPTYTERFQVASQRTKMSPYQRDLLKTAFIKTERFLDNVEIMACHLARATEIACAVIWRAQQAGYINKELAHLLLSIRYEHLPDRYKYSVDKTTGVISEASVLESAECAYKAFSVSEVENVTEQFKRSDAYFKHLACHQYDSDSLFLEHRLHQLKIDSSSSEEEVVDGLHRNEDPENGVSCAYSRQAMTFSPRCAQEVENKFVRFNEVEVEFFNQLLQEHEKIKNSQLRYHWQINLEQLMNVVCSVYEENQSILSESEDEDLEDKCYSKVAKIIYCAKSSLDHVFRGESILFGSTINHNDPDSIQRGLQEVLTSYEERAGQTVKCHLYDDELIDQFIAVSNKKIYAQYQHAEKQQKDNYKKEKALLSFTAFSKKVILKNNNKLKLEQLQLERQIKEVCILKIGNAAKQQGAENILLYLNPSLNTSIKVPQEEQNKEAPGYFLRQKEISLHEDSSKRIKKEFNFDMNTIRAQKRKGSETGRDRLSGCSFWETPISTPEKDNHLIEKSLKKNILNIPFSKSACVSK